MNPTLPVIPAQAGMTQFCADGLFRMEGMLP